MITLASIVEGHGEVAAVPLLLRRIVEAALPGSSLITPTPFRLPRGKFGDAHEVGWAVAVASRRVSGTGGLVILLDADDECPVALAANVHERVAKAAQCPVSVIAVVREFEAWFLASLPSLGSHPDITAGLPVGLDAEQVRDAKGRLQGAFASGKYSPTRHQPAFAAAMALDEARACRSFRKLEKEVRVLIGAPSP